MYHTCNPSVSHISVTCNFSSVNWRLKIMKPRRKMPYQRAIYLLVWFEPSYHSQFILITQSKLVQIIITHNHVFYHCMAHHIHVDLQVKSHTQSPGLIFAENNRFTFWWACTYQCQVAGGGGHRAGIWHFSKKFLSNSLPRAKMWGQI